jgi:septum formation protein
VWRQVDRRIILASRSPRRLDILKLMGLRFETAVPKVGVEEKFLRSGPLSASLQALAIAKAGSVAAGHPHALVLGADTVVVLGKRVLGKPKNRGDARAMIALLSGKEHHVLTAVALVCAECAFTSSAVARTRVVFRAIPREERNEYVARGDWRDKAGAYAIQGKAMAFVDRIEGCFYNVVGLPVRTTIDCFTEYASVPHGRVSKGQRAWPTKTK